MDKNNIRGNKPMEIKINFPSSLVGGAYSNQLSISHTPEEFIMDFIMVAPPSGAVTSRVIISPGHMKRIANAIIENLKKYEDKFGEIKKSSAPKVGMPNVELH